MVHDFGRKILQIPTMYFLFKRIAKSLFPVVEHLPIAGVMGTLLHSMLRADVTKKKKKRPKASNQIGSLYYRYVHVLT